MKIAVSCDGHKDWVDALQARLGELGRQVKRQDVRAWIKSGLVRRQGKPLRLHDPLQSGWLELLAKLEPVPAPAEPSLVYRDEHLLVVDKPAGLLTHPSADPRLPDLVSWVRQQGAPEATLQNRLDRETSGLVLFTLSHAARAPLAQAIEAHQVEKTYLARVGGSPPRVGRIDIALGESQGRVRADPRGKAAVTEFERIGPGCLKLRPLHGRKHQLRVHCALRGWPILGDPLYGGQPAERLWLHAWRLRLTHPVSGEELNLQALAPGFLIGP